MKIRAAKDGDLVAIRSLLATCELPTEDVTTALLPGFLVAVDERGAIVGSVCLESLGADALLRSLAVDLHLRATGLGTFLLQAIEREARACTYASLWLLTTSAQRIFEHRGYSAVDRTNVPREVRETTQFMRLCPSTAVCMRKRIA
ncbi:arsenic resistance N-acetyltransferase ArsN2 [Paraburkholderia sp. BL10I2N1]|uniref:arsenic resistance N-acetyltransferase ArsN2 n=1 Tax=Paraburkholderia sp. BL10I2N1 TaxID=1938796 RepID=UPI00105E63C2|nr:arsenic resistance N-acetyltransferase ArsN2 [Paraburkholderia sp. BL10I2N1]TDN62092.1 amino-acid N-acetyltransferase [Paraburkholderia sp. BL10I2N1]